MYVEATHIVVYLVYYSSSFLLHTHMLSPLMPSAATLIVVSREKHIPIQLRLLDLLRHYFVF